mgnify:CR=1 FL=1
MADPNSRSAPPLAESVANNMNEAFQWMARMWGSPAAPVAAAEALRSAQMPVAPGVASMLMPTLDPQELDKRIRDLRTVEHWLDMNRALLHTTIQTLEMQRDAIVAMHSMARGAPGAAAPAGASGEEPPAGDQAPPFNPALWWQALQEQFTRVAAAAVAESPPPDADEPPPADEAADQNPATP